MIVDMDGFNERLFRKTGSKSTVRSYAAGIRKFETFATEKYGLNLGQVAERMESRKLDVYKVLDQFVGWLNARGAMPTSVKAYTMAVKSLLRYLDVQVLNETFRSKVVMSIAEQIPVVPPRLPGPPKDANQRRAASVALRRRDNGIRGDADKGSH